MKEPQSVQHQLHVSLRLEAVQLLVELGAELNATWLRGAGCDTAPSNPGCRFQVRNGAGETPLMLVCRKGHAQAGLAKSCQCSQPFVTSRRPSSCWRCALTRRPRACALCHRPAPDVLDAFAGGRDEARGHAAADRAAPWLPGAPKLLGTSGQGPPPFSVSGSAFCGASCRRRCTRSAPRVPRFGQGLPAVLGRGAQRGEQRGEGAERERCWAFMGANFPRFFEKRSPSPLPPRPKSGESPRPESVSRSRACATCAIPKLLSGRMLPESQEASSRPGTRHQRRAKVPELHNSECVCEERGEHFCKRCCKGAPPIPSGPSQPRPPRP